MVVKSYGLVFVFEISKYRLLSSNDCGMILQNQHVLIVLYANPNLENWVSRKKSDESCLATPSSEAFGQR